MPLYQITDQAFRPIEEASFVEMQIRERGDLQRMLRTQIDVLGDDLYVLTEEFSEWEDSKRRIDLLAIDSDANLVVIELKRTQDGGHMELQAIRYASMVSAMTFDRAVQIHGEFLSRLGESHEDARGRILEFLGWEDADEDLFAADVRILLVSEDFRKELTTAVLWLRDREIDIRCVRLRPYRDSGRTMIDVQQIIPLPEVEDYQIQLREKEQRGKRSRSSVRWDRATFMSALEHRKGKIAREIADALLDWLLPQVSYPWYGYGEKDGGIILIIKRGQVKYHVCRLTTRGTLVFGFDWLHKKPPFDELAVRKLLLQSINEIPGVNFDETVLSKRARIPFDELDSEDAMQKLKAAVTWLVDQIPED